MTYKGPYSPYGDQGLVGTNSMADRTAGSGVNAMEERFMAFLNPDIRTLYEQAAYNAGLQTRIGTDSRLTPIVVSETTVINANTETDPDVPVSFNADIRDQTLRFFFQDGAFIRRITATVIAPVLTADALAGAGAVPVPPFEPQVLTTQPFGDLDASDYIYVMMERDGAGQRFMTRPIPLSETCGDGAHAYFFNLIPVVQPGGSIIMNLSINPPGRGNDNFETPPFIDRIGLVTISFHCERANFFGV